MASAPSDPKPILGRVDSSGRLIAADSELERLQVEAGSALGSSLALPQLAAIVRMVQRLGIPVSRQVLAAGREQDVDMWVRAVPEGGEVALSIEQWTSRQPSLPRLAGASTVQHEKFETGPLAWSVDEQLRFVSVAPGFAELLSIDVSDISGQPLTKVFRLEEDDHGAMPLIDALALRSAFSGQPVRARGSDRQLMLSGGPASVTGGGFAGFEGVATVVGSAPCPAAAAGIEVETTIRTALRSPLDSIIRSAEDMIDRSGADVRAEYSAYAADIATAAKHLLSVIRSLGEDSESASANRVDVGKLARDAAALVEKAAKERQIAIGVEQAEGIFASGEPRSVTQVLVNLIGNAVRYSSERTAVTVSLEKSRDSVLVHVADEGPGIDPADQERIFEPFQKGSDAGDGSGLGLAIARRLARAMGGDIELESAPGCGARFTLVLPAA